MKKCQYRLCSETYIPKTHNQKYHNDECCRLATNERIMDRYYERKAQRTAVKICQRCKVKLSQYNHSSMCGPCAAAEFAVDIDALAV